MDALGINSSGDLVLLNNDYPDPTNDTPAGDGLTDLRGSRPADSEWTWWIPS